MLRRKRKPPSKPFIHSARLPDPRGRSGRRDSRVYLGDGLWRAECARSFESFTEPLVDDRVRLDPLDPKFSRHLGSANTSPRPIAACSRSS